jgi:hypothetical protein
MRLHKSRRKDRQLMDHLRSGTQPEPAEEQATSSSADRPLPANPAASRAVPPAAGGSRQAAGATVPPGMPAASPPAPPSPTVEGAVTKAAAAGPAASPGASTSQSGPVPPSAPVPQPPAIAPSSFPSLQTGATREPAPWTPAMSQGASLPPPPGQPSAIPGAPSQLADTVESLKAAMELWRSDLARAGAQAEERLFRVLEVLESRVAQNQALTTEIKELQSNSASWLTRAMEEWKAEVRQGAGLSEVRVLSAIESVALRIAELQDSETQSFKQLERRSTDIGRNLEAGLDARIDTVKAAQEETKALLETSAKSIGGDAKSALSRLSDLSAAVAASEESTTAGLVSINASIVEWKSGVDEWKAAVAESAGKTEARLLRALEALEQSITKTGEVTTAVLDRAERNHGELSGAVRDMRASLEALTERSNNALRESVTSGLTTLESNMLKAVDSGLAPITTAVTSPRLEELLLARLEDL